MNKHNLIQSALVGAMVTIAFVVIITIAGELYKVTGVDGKAINPIKDFLKGLHGHHWVGKSIWAIGLFVITTVGTYLSCKNYTTEHPLNKYVWFLTVALILGTAILYAFFAYEFVTLH